MPVGTNFGNNDEVVKYSKFDSEGFLRCSLCGFFSQGVNRKQNFQQHMRTHTGEKPFQCHLCPMRCLKKGNLKRHLRTTHFDSTSTKDF